MSNSIHGVLKRLKNNSFVVRLPEKSFRAGTPEIRIHPSLARKSRLEEGTSITGNMEKKGGKRTLVSIESLGGTVPSQFGKRTRYPDLTAIDPLDRFNLGADGDTSMRIIDLIAPIGKGTRGLIVSPPKAGKTVLLEQIVQAILRDSPESYVIVLLLDERPEEVTQFRRAVTGAEILASTSDHSADEHAELAEFVLKHVQIELECGREVVLLIDSLTRLGRAFNNRSRGRSRQRPTMTGGLESGVLEVPRRLFGLARNIENGGSATIIASCLTNTGSRMDQLIFEEFKGTGNSEIILDRSLAEARIFPAIDIPASGTRKEARLYSERENHGLVTLRRVLSNYGPRDAMQALFKLLKTYPTNEEFLAAMASRS